MSTPLRSRRTSRSARRRRPSRAQLARRRLLAVLGVAATALVLAVLIPALNHAYRQITLPLEHADIIRQQAHEKHLDPALIAGVIFAESKFRPRTSAAGAEGLMQIEPQTAVFIARRSGATRFTTADLATPQVNVAYGSWYLRYLLGHYGGDEVLALAAYNGGIANVDGWVARARADGRRLEPGTIPFPETRGYVLRVLKAQRDYRANYARELGI